MKRIFNRKVINKSKNIIDDKPMFRSKHHYNGIVHANILRELRLNKRKEKQEWNEKMKSFEHNLKVSSSPASIRKMKRSLNRMHQILLGNTDKDVA